MVWHFSAEVLLSTGWGVGGVFLDNQLLLKEQVTAVAKRDFAKTKHQRPYNRICVSLHLKIMWKVQLIYNATAWAVLWVMHYAPMILLLYKHWWPVSFELHFKCWLSLLKSCMALGLVICSTIYLQLLPQSGEIKQSEHTLDLIHQMA